MPQREFDILDKLVSIKKKIGYTSLCEKIDGIELSYYEEIKRKVIEEVCEVVVISPEYLLDNKIRARDDKKQMAVNYVCAILKLNFNFEIKNIKDIFNIHISNVSRRIGKIRLMRPDSKVDAKYIKEYETIINNLKEKKVLTD